MRALVFLFACAPAVLLAQQPPPVRPPSPPADTARKPAVREAVPSPDSALADPALKSQAPALTAHRDTIKTPTARPYTPRSVEIGPTSWHWDRDAMFASGALTVGDLLSQVPGVTILTTGFILAPAVVAWYGDPGRVRVFIDGVERDAVNVRNRGVTDFAALPMFAFEDVKLERTAGELRVHLRTWRVDRTTPATRTDIMSGSENLNMYRGYFGLRFNNGAVIQVAGQQHSTVSPGGMDGDALGAMARVGWARGDWSVDGSLLRQGLNRSSGARFRAAVPQLNVLPPFKGSEGLGYLRVAWRDPEVDGPWLQLIASTVYAGENNSSTNQGSLIGSTTTTAIPGDSVDTTASRAQYTVAAGITKWGLRLSTTNRLRSINGKSYVSPGGRAEYASRLLTVSAFGERGVDSTIRTDLLARLQPLPWLDVGASLSRAAPKNASLGPAVTFSRLEAGVRLRGRWLSAGLVTRSVGLVAPPVELDSALYAVTSPASNGKIVAFRGELWRGFSLDVDAINWDAAFAYKPQTQVHTRLWFESSFLKTFPRHTFHLSVAGTYDYRSATYVPGPASPIGQTTRGAGALGSLLEIRIGTAVISWQTRNMMGEIFETYPGYVMPRLVNIYGLRWEFWN